jgi:glycosyltransferase involved in cell wall biosynthesis
VRILFCTSEAPLPPTTGFRLVVAALLRELRPRHEIHVLALRMPDQQEGEADDSMTLLPYPRRTAITDARDVVRALASGRPLRAAGEAALFRPPLEGALAEWNPDVVHVTSGRLAGLGPALRGRPTVLAPLDALHVNLSAQAQAAHGIRRALLRDEARRVRNFQASAYADFGRIVLVTREDAEAVRRLNPSLRVEAIPNGVDVDSFARPAGAEREPDTIVFSGVMSFAPNVLAAEYLARDVMPLVRARRPQARLFLVGRAPSPAVRALAGLEGVEVTGEVPDLRPWLVRAGAYVCPMVSGTGIKNKLLEAMAAEAPCVATPLALQGIDLGAGAEVLVGETPADLARQTVTLLEDPALGERLGRAGRAYVEQHHDWSAVGRAYERLYETVRDEASERSGRPSATAR